MFFTFLTRSGYRGSFQTQGTFGKSLHFREVGVFISKNKIFVWVGAKTLNDTKLEWRKSRNSKLSNVKCRKAIITNDFKVSNKNFRTHI